ncbi:TPA: glycosyltransferase, partial [Klebsiella pneumoniae]|nr:glycosyltransferase [Klebsiella pneumoniae]
KQMISWERKVFNRAGEITVLNDKDKDIVKTIINWKNVRINVDYPKVSGVFHDVNRNNVTLNNIIFWGAMNRKENIDAVFWFLNEIFPLIIKKIPDSTFYIVGANPPEEIVQMQSEKILVTGFVESPIPFFEKAALSVVPLRFGAGIKLKVLETLTAKIPTLATDVGAEGIDNINGCLFVENEPEKFAAQAVKILESRS